MQETTTLRHLLEETDRFITCIELVTSRGTLARPRRQAGAGYGPGPSRRSAL